VYSVIMMSVSQWLDKFELCGGRVGDCMCVVSISIPCSNSKILITSSFLFENVSVLSSARCHVYHY
jgi:hypothetical protein